MYEASYQSHICKLIWVNKLVNSCFNNKLGQYYSRVLAGHFVRQKNKEREFTFT